LRFLLLILPCRPHPTVVALLIFVFVPGPRAARFVLCFLRYRVAGPVGPECSLRISSSRVFLWPREWWSPVVSIAGLFPASVSGARSKHRCLHFSVRFGACCAQGSLPPIFPIAIFSIAQYSARQVPPVSFIRCSFFRSICSARSVFHLQPRPARCFLLTS
jgi:hypothetical protein